MPCGVGTSYQCPCLFSIILNLELIYMTTITFSKAGNLQTSDATAVTKGETVATPIEEYYED